MIVIVRTCTPVSTYEIQYICISQVHAFAGNRQVNAAAVATKKVIVYIVSQLQCGCMFNDLCSSQIHACTRVLL